MGVDSRDYVIYGYDVKDDKILQEITKPLWEEKFKCSCYEDDEHGYFIDYTYELRKNNSEFQIITDCYSSDYAYFGITLIVGNSSRWEDGHFREAIGLTTKDINKYKKKLAKILKDNNLVEAFSEFEPKFYIFTHYT